jgi:hypothetical protein
MTMTDETNLADEVIKMTGEKLTPAERQAAVRLLDRLADNAGNGSRRRPGSHLSFRGGVPAGVPDGVG